LSRFEKRDPIVEVCEPFAIGGVEPVRGYWFLVCHFTIIPPASSTGITVAMAFGSPDRENEVTHSRCLMLRFASTKAYDSFRRPIATQISALPLLVACVAPHQA
jgi:hypothetical protein